MNHHDKINVLLVEYSIQAIQGMCRALLTSPEIGEVETASDVLRAMKKLQETWPHVMVLDADIPHLDVAAFLKMLAVVRPIPVVIFSRLTEQGLVLAEQALAAGVACVVAKPNAGFSYDAKDMIAAVKQAMHSDRHNLTVHEIARYHPNLCADVILSANTNANGNTHAEVNVPVVAIGTSMGGIDALEKVLTKLPASCPGMVIVQHIPEHYSGAFAAHLDSVCQIHVREAKHGDHVVSGQALIAPGNRHMLLKRRGCQYHVELVDGPPVRRHCPSVDVLFRSASTCTSENALGIIMTGMGDDGAHGLKEMHDTGARTVAQDEASCVMYSMPRAAIRLGAVDRVMPLTSIPDAILGYGGH